MADLSTVRLLDLIEPGNPGYDEARTPWLTNIEQRPAAIALPADADDMAAVVRRAARTGHRLALQSTGHHAHTLGGLERTILVRTTRMRSVSVDPQQRVARVGAGAVWSDVVTAAERHGLAPLAGSSGDVVWRATASAAA